MADNGTLEVYYNELDQLENDLGYGLITQDEFKRMKRNLDQWLADEVNTDGDDPQ